MKDRSAYKKQWYQRNRERLLEMFRAYHEAHREERLATRRERYRARAGEFREKERVRRKKRANYLVAYQREYRKTNRDRLRDQKKSWRHENQEAVRAYYRRYAKGWRAKKRSDPDYKARKTAEDRRYYLKNRERRIAYVADWQRRNRPEVRRYQNAWRRRFPEMARALSANRRARKKRAGGSFTAAEWRRLLAEYEGRCTYCGANGDMTADHRIPLSAGGSNNISNILPACMSCNSRKQSMTELEYRARLGRRKSTADRGSFAPSVTGAGRDARG